MIERTRDRELMKLALGLSKRSRAEDDGRIHPFVGAVIAHPNGSIISEGYRGRYTPGNHAEQEALIDIDEDVTAGTIVYTTLEPCTFRGKQMPCCHRLLDRRVSEVVIGILDPNRDIRGRGWWKLEERGIRVRNFDEDLVREIRAMNAAFIDDQLGPGLRITHVLEESGRSIEIADEHRQRKPTLSVTATTPKQQLVVRGTYRLRPQPGHRIRLFVRRHSKYWPQAPVNFAFDRDNSIWEAQPVWVAADADGIENEIVLANLNDDLLVATRHYMDVHNALSDKLAPHQAWVPIDMDPEPPGFVRLTFLQLTVFTKSQ